MKKLDADRNGLPPYAWPGGYPVMYLARDGWRDDESGVLDFSEHDRTEATCCAKCAADTKQWPDIIITSEYIHYEGAPEYCEFCNSFTDSAYGDPEAKDESAA